jgi:ribosome-binding protein aMBF1 (putative translation factor)
MGRRGDGGEVFNQVYDLQNGVRVRFQAAVCGKCGFTHMVRDAATNRRRPPVAIAQAFREAGWSIGARRSGDLCPKCSAPRRRRREAPTETVFEVLEEPMSDAPSAAEEPRQPTRDDNRRIREELDATYDEAAGRYRKSWTDQALAEKLKVPRAWVAGVREGFYGPDTNEAAQAKALLVANAEGRLQQLIDRGYTVLGELEAELAAVRQELGR